MSAYRISPHELPDYEELRRRKKRCAAHALDSLILSMLASGPKSRRQLVSAGKNQEFTPSDVRSSIDRLCWRGDTAHDKNEKGDMVVRLVQEAVKNGS